MEKPIITIKRKPSFWGVGTVFLIIIILICLPMLNFLSAEKSRGGEVEMLMDALEFIFLTPIAISAFLLIITYISYKYRSAKYNKLKNDIEENKKWFDGQSGLVQTNHKDTHNKPENPIND